MPGIAWLIIFSVFGVIGLSILFYPSEFVLGIVGWFVAMFLFWIFFEKIPFWWSRFRG